VGYLSPTKEVVMKQVALETETGLVKEFLRKSLEEQIKSFVENYKQIKINIGNLSSQR
jgi:hypothetical protein